MTYSSKRGAVSSEAETSGVGYAMGPPSSPSANSISKDATYEFVVVHVVLILDPVFYLLTNWTSR
jgi:hypothetical protein